MLKSHKVLLLVPHLSTPGGVSNFYNTINIERNGVIQYFFVNKQHPQSNIAATGRLISKYVSFIWKIVNEKYTLVHINPSLYPRSFYRDAIFIILAKLLRRKTLIFFHGWLDDFEEEIKVSKLKYFLFNISYARADKFIVLGEAFRKKLLNLGVANNKEFFIRATVADSTYLSEINLYNKFCSFQERVVFLFLSRITLEKGIYIAIESFRKFTVQNPDRKSLFIIAGDGPELNTAKKYVLDNNILNVEFTGYVEGERKNAILMKSHIMFLPSYTEGLPCTILEGMLYGMPIVSRVTGAIPDIIQQGVNGYLTSSFENSTFTKYLSRLAMDYKLYKAIAKQNHEVAIRNYTKEKIQESMLQVYKTF